MDGGPYGEDSVCGKESVEEIVLKSAPNSLLENIRSRVARVCVVGLGYVGMPLSVASAEAGFTVVGVDVSKEKVRKVNSGECYVEDKYSERFLPEFVKAGRIKATTRLREGAGDADVVIICVPTPLSKEGEPDLGYVKSLLGTFPCFFRSSNW